MKKTIAAISSLIVVLVAIINGSLADGVRGLDGGQAPMSVNLPSVEGRDDLPGLIQLFGTKRVEPDGALRVLDNKSASPVPATPKTTVMTTKPVPAEPTTEETEPAKTETTSRTQKKTTKTTVTKPPTQATTWVEPTTTTTETTTRTTEPTPAPETTTEPVTTVAAAPDGYFCYDFESEVVRLVNIERAKEGIGPVTMNSSLRSSAAVRAVEIIDKFDHTRPNGQRWCTAIKIKYACAGENIAAGQRSPDRVVQAWMNSASHRKNIMNGNYSEIGVACYHAPGQPYLYYWGQLFVGY